jgi:hypothetical protein
MLTSDGQSIKPLGHYKFLNELSSTHCTHAIKLQPFWLPFQLQHLWQPCVYSLSMIKRVELSQ